jgi:hypothetical protein
MSATTVFGQVRSEQASTHSKRNAFIVFTVIALFALSFFVGRATATSHVSSSAQVATHTQLSPADRAIVANDVANTGTVTAAKLSPADRAIVANDVANTGTVTAAKLSPADRAIVAGDLANTAPLSGTLTTEKMSAANRAEIANDLAPLSGTGTTTQLSPANRAEIANDVAPVTPQLSQANSATCVAGRPC